MKAQGARLNVSGVLQEALDARLAELARHDALGEAIEAYVADSGSFTQAELDEQAAADRAGLVYPRKKRRSTAT